jgi:hypothetical protein
VIRRERGLRSLRTFAEGLGQGPRPFLLARAAGVGKTMQVRKA